MHYVARLLHHQKVVIDEQSCVAVTAFSLSNTCFRFHASISDRSAQSQGDGLLFMASIMFLFLLSPELYLHYQRFPYVTKRRLAILLRHSLLLHQSRKLIFITQKGSLKERKNNMYFAPKNSNLSLLGKCTDVFSSYLLSS